MKLRKIQKYLENTGIGYNYRILEDLPWITITDKLNNFVRIDEENKKWEGLKWQYYYQEEQDL